jgi:hypothetical protein
MLRGNFIVMSACIKKIRESSTEKKPNSVSQTLRKIKPSQTQRSRQKDNKDKSRNEQNGD